MRMFGQTIGSYINRLMQPRQTLQGRFKAVYQQNMWRDGESRSGPGSRRDSDCVLAALQALNMAYDQHGVRSISDIPCGDFNWIGAFLNARPDITYCGYDIVPELIAANNAAYAGKPFTLLNIAKDIPPKADLIFCKDLLNHLNYNDIRSALANMKASGSTWLLASNNFDQRNEELPSNFGGSSRLLDICAEPLNYAAPVWNTHYLGLWRLADL
jgi:hypothetical protein